MNARQALRALVKDSGLTALEISRRIGRTDNYVSSLLSRGSTPTAETLATIAEACGWKLCLVAPTRTVQIDGWDLTVDTTVPVDGRSADAVPFGEGPGVEGTTGDDSME